MTDLDGVMKRQCATCPFREDGKGFKEVRGLLETRAMTEATPICHSTGDSDLTSRLKKITRKNLACRGARDLQLKLFHALGFIEAPTDEAWAKKANQMGLNKTKTKTKGTACLQNQSD